MVPQTPHQPRPSHLQLHSIIPSSNYSCAPPRTTASTPATSPGLFSPSGSRAHATCPSQTMSEGTTPIVANSHYLHPLQSHRVRETHRAVVDHNNEGRKIINHYEIVEELGRGMHGKVKLAVNKQTRENVAIKIIPRFSKKRKLGKVMRMGTVDKTHREIAILKKVRHPNTVALLEIIDDPELKKIYMVLEHVELGEIVWRKKGVPHICAYERRRVEKEMRGETPTEEEELYDRMLERRQALKDMKRAKMSQMQGGADPWSIEYGAADEDHVDAYAQYLPRGDLDIPWQPLQGTPDYCSVSRAASAAPSRTHSVRSLARSGASHQSEADLAPAAYQDELETAAAAAGSSFMTGLEGSIYGAYVENSLSRRDRAPSMADSIISHMSSVDYNVKSNDPLAEDYSYVPCFTQEQARVTFRDTVLGLEYLHYEGIIHRDIKPANLLWTREHHVKISDFGVSYFGRPMREGDFDDAVSESEAQDFDNDLELSKTVGTPAFFAPELCYTDSFDGGNGRSQGPPKVGEQMDVWSLGVTLYCIIFARIPFPAEDEWQMFHKIANESPHIPRKRLRPVDPSSPPDQPSLYSRSTSSETYRDDNQLEYEEIDSDLLDLLGRMLVKNPDKRIRLRDVKRHRWVLQGIPDVVAWLDDTDPGNRTAGRKIHVDEREITDAVVPLTFLERARSAMKKVAGKMMSHRGDRSETSSRRRATSSAASSAGDSSPGGGVGTSLVFRDARRRSLRPDDYLVTPSSTPPPLSYAHSEHPLTQSVTASPGEAFPDSIMVAPQLSSAPVGGQLARHLVEPRGGFNHGSDADPQARAASTAPTRRSLTRHTHSHSITNAGVCLRPRVREAATVPTTPLLEDTPGNLNWALRKSRDMSSVTEDSSRARSVDRGLFSSSDKRAEAKVAISTAFAPGSLQLPHRLSGIRSSDVFSGIGGHPLTSPRKTASPLSMSDSQHGQPRSEPDVHNKRLSQADLEERTQTAQRIQGLPDACDGSLKSEAMSQTAPWVSEDGLSRCHGSLKQDLDSEPDPASVPCPPSRSPSRNETIATLSSSRTSMDGTNTPLTTPSETSSPLHMTGVSLAKAPTPPMTAFQSDPALPALLSSTSSLSADTEGDFLNSPGVPGAASVIDTSDSLTPPALIQEPIAGFPLREEHAGSDAVLVRPQLTSSSASQSRGHNNGNESGGDSESDEGLTLARPNKTTDCSQDVAPPEMLVGGPRRRDTNASIGSTDTAKKITMGTTE